MKPLKEYLKTTPKYLALLSANGINTIRDFFLYFPRTYEDRKNLVLLSDIQSEQVKYTVKLHLNSMVIINWGKWRKIITFACNDSTGEKATVNFFYAPYIVWHIRTNQWYLVVGKPKNNRWTIAIWHPEMVLTEGNDGMIEWEMDPGSSPGSQVTSPGWQIELPWDSSAEFMLSKANVPQNDGKRVKEILEQDSYLTNRIYPVYSETQWIKSSWFAKKVRENMSYIPELFGEYLPKSVVEEAHLHGYMETIRDMHYPETMEDAQAAHRRVSFDKLLWVQLSSIMQRQQYQKWHVFDAQKLDWNVVKELVDALPFTLTQAQKKCIKAIVENLHETKPMLRLLQWDVWSGKTIVAAIAAYYVIKKYWWQVAFLAPLEVLAQQHYRSISKILLPLWIRIECLTWSTPAAEKKRIKWSLKAGNTHVVIWTHALLQDDIEYKKLFFVVIDEQHKFGVRQRWFFKKFWSPHIVQMTATPIPRSMALAFFGEFDVSTIDEMPAGRKPIQTKIVSESEYKKLKQRVLTKLSQDQRLFIVTPLIDESEIMIELKSAKQEFEEAKMLYPELAWKIWLMHGKMKPAEKQEVMDKFKKGEYMVLVSTTVIEVGIDVPEATIMIIKNSDRFGLAQLHQLRGRVWRSDVQSYCFLETKHKAWDSYQRLRAMEEYNDWFKLAELDLKYRGAWEFLWTRQSGVTDIPYEMMSDTKFLELIQQTAISLLEKYPWLVGLEVLQSQVKSIEGELLV